MAFPLALPAIAKGAAALSAALGLTAVVTSNKNEHSNSGNTERLNNAFVQQNLPLMIATNVAKAKMQQPATTIIPTAENALVLRPEYRTVTTPIEALDIFGYKPIWAENEGSQNGASGSGEQSGTGSGTGKNTPNPENEKDKRIKELEEELSQLKNKPKKSKEYYDSEKDLSWRAPVSSAGKFLFKSRVPGEYTPFRTLLEYSTGIGALGLIGYHGGKALGLWGEDNNNSSTEIDKEAYFKDSGGIYVVE